jgi:hypothetical protein
MKEFMCGFPHQPLPDGSCPHVKYRPHLHNPLTRCGVRQGVTTPSDVLGKIFADIFGSNGLADNGGYPKTIAPSGTVGGATVEELEAIKETYELPRGDVSKDQRGFSRSISGATSKGAYDAAAQQQ